jgi:tetratricopeptide (TPR) repeat protein
MLRNGQSFPLKTDVLYKLAILKESQSDFRSAAEYYSQLLQLLDNRPNDPANAMQQFYTLKYANALERAGLYDQAARFYWSQYEQAPPGQRHMMINHLLENSKFRRVSDEEMQKLHTLVMEGADSSLAFELAELYRLQERPEVSYEIYQENVKNNLPVAMRHISSIIDVYRTQDKMDELLGDIHNLRGTGLNALQVMLFELKLLEQTNQTDEALKVVEEFIRGSGIEPKPGNIQLLMNRIPIEVLDRWADFLLRADNAEAAATIYQGMIQQLPLDLPRHQKLSDIYRTTGREQEAINLWTQWAARNQRNPLALFNAVDRLKGLGAEDQAVQLMQQMQGTVPAPFAYKQAEVLLELGQYEQAFASFEIARASGAMTPDSIVRTLVTHAGNPKNLDALVSSFVQSATSQPFSSIPAWKRDTLIILTIQNQLRDQVEAILNQDEEGVWKYHLAQETLRQGDRQWAEELLNLIPDDSLYYPIAQRKLADVYREVQTIPAQQKAAELLRPSLAVILDTTEPIPLNYSLVERLLDYAEMRLNAFQAGEALIAIREIESASPTLGTPLTPAMEDRLRFARARALVELAGFDGAISLLESIQNQPYKSEAQYLLANVYLAQEKVDEAKSLLYEMANSSENWRRSNDALTLISALEPLVGESLDLFTLARLYGLQGRFKDAIPVLRELAVNTYGEDTEEWARYQIGKMNQQLGNREEARDEWQRLQVEADHPIIHGLVRYELIQEPLPSGSGIRSTTEYQDFLIDFPDTLFSDLARIQYQQLNERGNP